MAAEQVLAVALVAVVEQFWRVRLVAVVEQVLAVAKW